MEFEKGSGNVFKDLGFPDAETHLLKSDIVIRIDIILRHSRWTRKRAAKVLGLSQTKLFRILRGSFRDYSVEYLSRLLDILKRNVKLRKDIKSVTHALKSQHLTKKWRTNEKKKESIYWGNPRKYRQALYNNRSHYNNGNNTKMDSVADYTSSGVSGGNIRTLPFLKKPLTWTDEFYSPSFHSVSSTAYPSHTRTHSDNKQFWVTVLNCQKSSEVFEQFVPFKNDLEPPQTLRW